MVISLEVLEGNRLTWGSPFSPISSVTGSSSLLFAQPLLTGSVFASTAVLISAEIFLFVTRRLFNLKSVPVLDARNGQTVQMSLTELQEFLGWMSNGNGSAPFSNASTAGTNGTMNQDGRVTTYDVNGDSTGFITVDEPEAPLTVAIYFSAFYSNNPYTPSVSFFIPIIAFPGLSGALPLLILGLLATIFVRAVVPPESTGAKPLKLKPDPGSSDNHKPLTYSPNDLLQLLTKYSKFSGKSD